MMTQKYQIIFWKLNTTIKLYVKVTMGEKDILIISPSLVKKYGIYKYKFDFLKSICLATTDLIYLGQRLLWLEVNINWREPSFTSGAHQKKNHLDTMIYTTKFSALNQKLIRFIHCLKYNCITQSEYIHWLNLHQPRRH